MQDFKYRRLSRQMKGVSFQSNCGAASVGEYDKAICAINWIENVNWPA